MLVIWLSADLALGYEILLLKVHPHATEAATIWQVLEERGYPMKNAQVIWIE